MNPEKETTYILRRLIEMWGHYCDGWEFSVTWDRKAGEHGEWTLRARKDDVDVTHQIAARDWLDRHHAVVDDAAETMYHATFVKA